MESPNDSGQREVPEGGDDEAITVAFRRSLIGILIVSVLVGLGIGVVMFNGQTQDVVKDKRTDAPEPLVADAAILPSVPFADITIESGIDFVHVNGAQGDKLLPETMGSGAAFFDADGDGDQDVLLVNAASWPVIFTGNTGIRRYIFKAPLQCWPTTCCRAGRQ